MLEDGPRGGGAEDDGDDARGASTVRTVEDVGAEGAAEQTLEMFLLWVAVAAIASLLASLLVETGILGAFGPWSSS